MGFKNPSIQSSVGGKAICISGMMDIAASANNVKINLEPPTNRSMATELIRETLQINSTLAKEVVVGQQNISGTYGIYSQLCFPMSTGVIDSTTIQFLVHGSGFDRSYWNPVPGYSYVDTAAEQGYTTFLYDRLGTGISDHPDAIQVVQASLQIAIAHELIQLLRTGGIANHSFERIIGVGHSFGSIQLTGITSKFPKDVDAVVLTGFSAEPDGMPISFAALDLTIASQVEPSRFSALSNGYLTAASIEGNQFFFLRTPGVDPALLYFAESTKQTVSLGEFFTTSSVPGTSKDFKGPVYVVNGENDMPNCLGNCYLPENLAAGVITKLYPSASNGSNWYLAPQTGHGLNFHYSATTAYEHILDFLKTNGF